MGDQQSGGLIEWLSAVDPPAQRPAQPEVLVIDDDDGIRVALKLYFSDLYDLTLCSSGEEGTEKLRPEAHAVILDIKMKGKDGFATFCDLRQRSPNVPIIFYSAYQSLKDPMEILNEFRPFGYVFKDANPRALADTVASAVAHYKQIMHNKKLVAELQELNTSLERRVEERTLALHQRTRDLEDALQRLKLLTETDSLTEIANRRHFFSVYEEMVESSQRHGGALCLVLIDIDHFKRINDRYGHPCGDAVLRAVASQLRSNIRAGDLLARVGGEEFALLAPGVDAETAPEYIERLRQAVEACEVSVDDETPLIKTTISLGCCSAEGVTLDPEQLYKLADRALYIAKERGRNNSLHHVYSPPSIRGPLSVR